MNSSTQIVVITGQTATGKTAHAIDCAKRCEGVIISGDSRQAYKELDIVTGKDRDMLAHSGVPYYGIDVVRAGQPYSSHDWVQMATEVINTSIDQGKTPIVVGGSWLYIKHLVYGFDVTAPPNYTLRDKLNTLSVAELQTKLETLAEHDMLAPLNESDRMNPHRLIRRIEILTHYHQHPSAKQEQHIKPKWQATIQGYRHATREKLEAAITKRVHQRMHERALEETKRLLNTYGEAAPGLQTIGYTQLILYLKGELTRDAAIAEWITKEMQYAKRQYTFMKQDASIQWNEVEIRA